ncbi:MAG TPA: hypothetical protein VGL86_01360 [Polyangia bacterium]|jgi:hypothetical protein
MDQPRRFRIHDQDGVTRIEWRWIRAAQLLAPAWLALICSMWWYWYTSMTEDGGLTVVKVLFLAVTALVVLGAFYLVLAKVCNRSCLIIDADSIELRQGPLPWPGSGRWPRFGLTGFVSVPSTVRYRGVSAGRYWTVYAVWPGMKMRRIAGDLRNEKEATWLATMLDGRFGQRAGSANKNG